MIRTQVYLEKQQSERLKRLAKVRNVPEAEVIRKALSIGLDAQEKDDYSGMHTLARLIQINATGGPRDLSTNLDHYLYGSPKRE